MHSDKPFLSSFARFSKLSKSKFEGETSIPADVFSLKFSHIKNSSGQLCRLSHPAMTPMVFSHKIVVIFLPCMELQNPKIRS